MVIKIFSKFKRKTNSRAFIVAVCFSLGFSFLFSGCEPTYKSDDLETSIKAILKKEYDITNVKIEIAGKTLGVYLPFDKLSSANFGEYSLKKKKEPESLFSFNEEAMDVIQDVLFTTSRVILSTNRPIDFYVLKAIEDSSTGLEFAMTGYVMDMKRVRYWDIAFSEYRKRLLRDISVNKELVWEKRVIEFFNAIDDTAPADLLDRFFVDEATLKDISPFFFSQVAEAEYKDYLSYEFLDVRTKQTGAGKNVLVYIKVQETYIPKEGYDDYNFLFTPGSAHEYIIVLETGQNSYNISQVIPFYYIDKDHFLREIEFPEEMHVYDHIDQWPTKYSLEEVFMGDFLGRQLTKRLQALAVAFALELDSGATQSASANANKVACEYRSSELDKNQDIHKYFSVFYSKLKYLETLGVSLKVDSKVDFRKKEKIIFYETLLREFTTVVLKKYKFNDFEYIEIGNVLTQDKIKFYKEELIDLKEKEFKSLVEAKLKQ